ncbi:MAG: VOC family protein [Streptosporangiaceae bacterium]
MTGAASDAQTGNAGARRRRNGPGDRVLAGRPYVDYAAEQDRERGRLVSLGAAEVDWDSYPEDPDFVVLADPDGNRFCIVDASHG